MDVLHPQLVWLGGRCYRKYPTNDVLADRNKQEDEIDDSIRGVCTDEPCDADFEFEKLPNGQFRTGIKVAKGYFGNIIGASGTVKNRIEMETRTRIFVPPRYGHGADGDITITGPTKAGTASARNRIELIVEAARQRQPFTHFVSIPMTDLKSKFLEFRDDVLRQCDGARGLDGSLFQKADRLHLTIGTMPILDQRERDLAVKLLAECNDIAQSVLMKEPLTIRVEGVEYMNDDPAEVDVLYAKITPSESGNRLQLLADRVVDRFINEGIMQKQHERVKLHLTLLNTLFRKDDSGELGVTDMRLSRGNKRESFDATRVLKLFENYQFGEVRVNSLHISQRYSNVKRGYYQALFKLDLL